MRKNQIPQIIKDLQTLGTILDQHPELDEPRINDTGDDVRMEFNYWNDRAAAKQIAHGIKAFAGIKFTKNDPSTGTYNEKYYILSGQLGSLKIEFSAYRESVCTRVVTATETVTEELPDPALVAKLPTVKTDRVIETVEWQCVPLLAKAEAVAS